MSDVIKDHGKLLIIMRGVPGSGKSFLAKSLAGKLGGKVFSTDKILTNSEHYLWSSEMVFEGHRINEELVKHSMSLKEKVIIVDNTNLMPTQTQPYITLSKQFGYAVEVHEPNTPWRYNVQLLLKHGTHPVPEEVITHMVKTWQEMPLSLFKTNLGIQ
jgi:NEDD4-binding protein 2